MINIEKELKNTITSNIDKREVFEQTIRFCMDNLCYWKARKQGPTTKFVATLKRMSQDGKNTVEQMRKFVLSNFFTIFQRSRVKELAKNPI